MQPDNSRIPIFQSDFLQDFSIELGKRLKSLRHRSSKLQFDVSRERATDNEKFTVTSWKPLRSYVQIIVWEDRSARYVFRKPYLRKEKAEYIQLDASLNGFSVSEIAQLIRDSLLDRYDVVEFWQRENAKLKLSKKDRQN